MQVCVLVRVAVYFHRYLVQVFFVVLSRRLYVLEDMCAC